MLETACDIEFHILLYVGELIFGFLCCIYIPRDPLMSSFWALCAGYSFNYFPSVIKQSPSVPYSSENEISQHYLLCIP